MKSDDSLSTIQIDYWEACMLKRFKRGFRCGVLGTLLVCSVVGLSACVMIPGVLHTLVSVVDCEVNHKESHTCVSEVGEE